MLKRSDLLYRLMHTEQDKLKQIMQDIKLFITKIGIDIHRIDGHTEFQHQQRCFEYYSGIFKIFKESQLRLDEGVYAFKQMLKADYEPKYVLTENEEPYYQLQGILTTVENMQKTIMECELMDESRSTVIKEYKIKDEGDNELEYQDSYSCNRKQNTLNFQYGYELNDEYTSDQIVQLRLYENVNKIKQFYDRYQEALKYKSPDFWSLLLFDVIKMLCNKNYSDDQLQESMINMLDDFDATKFLLQNRKQIIMYLVKNHIGGSSKQEVSSEKGENKDIHMKLTHYELLRSIGMSDIEIEKVGQINVKKEQQASQGNNSSNQKQQYDGSEEFTEIDFLRQDQSQLVQKFPTLEKTETPEYVQIKIDPMPRFNHQIELIDIKKNFPSWASQSFGDIQTLNVIQSKVYDQAFKTDENILICAPTGAGKTNIALMAVLHELEKHMNTEKKKLMDNNFKIIYISPMKALASEIVEKYTRVLSHLGVQCKELTGDMQLTKKEIEETQIIVTTPEKWDVFTRKKNEVADTLKLLIIDEIHLLNDERGPVLECLVSRTLQNIERQQRTVRMLGLSATLPNYLDVASFLHVKKECVFFFDSTFRPVPLMQRYIGVKDPKQGNSRMRRKKQDIYNDLAYQLAKGVLQHKKQVLIFVHSRKETILTGQFLLKKALDSNELNLIKPLNHDKHSIPKIQDKELNKLAPSGIGFHHAGMLRKDRNIVEKLFNEGNIRILVATATLAWGVNLPAYGVIIKGTDVYDPSRGGMQDLSVLDIQQMFGRAGRPQFDNNGEASLITDSTKLNSFVAQLNNASLIESRFSSRIKEALNAEIALGNISTIKEAFDWVNYSFYAIRLKRNPTAYQCRIQENRELSIEIHISEQIERTLDLLDKLRMIRWDRRNNYLSSTELGRITSHYYISCDTMNIFCRGLGIQLDNEEDVDENEKRRVELKSDLDILKIIAQAKEFENIKVRPEEMEELKNAAKRYWVFDDELELQVKRICCTDNNVGDDQPLIDTPEKTLILLSGYLFKIQYENFSLISDSSYVVQNSIRLLRCMQDIVTKKSMAYNYELITKWCKHLEQRLVPNENALRQFCKANWQGYNSFKQRKENRDGFFSEDVIYALENVDLQIDQIRNMPPHQLGEVINWTTKQAQIIQQFVSYIPRVEVEYSVKPIAQTVLKVDVSITPNWSWTSRWHSRTEVFTLVVDDENEIMHNESFTISQQQVQNQTPTEISFYVPFRDSDAPYYRLFVQHDTWVNQPETYEKIDLENIFFKGEKMEYTELLDLNPLPITALNNSLFESIYRMKYFNPNQTQVFHSIYNSDNNILIGSPTGSGKTIMAEFAALRVFNLSPEKKVIYIAPLKALAKERIADWEIRFGKILKKSVLELTGDYTPDMDSLLKADVLITTPEKWDGISRNWHNRSYVQKVGLVIFDEIHLLGQDRGPVLEVIVSRMNLIAQKTGFKVRMVGLSTAMSNGTDVADWFGAKKNYFFNFRPHVRPVPLKIYFDGFSAKSYCPRMTEMNKPAYQQIRKFGDKKPVLIFVSSRRQTRLTALDLISFAMHDIGAGQCPFVMCSEDDLQGYLGSIKDDYLKQTLSFGIGMHHAGLDADDKTIVEKLFMEHKIQVLVTTSTLAWGVNLPARLVIIKGTEYFDSKTRRYVDMPVTDILQMIGRAGRPQFDDKGIACVFVEQSKKNFYRKYLNDPFPIESSLSTQIHDHINAEISCGTITTQQQCIDWITWTYFFRRLLKNPTYYNLSSAETENVKQFMIELVDECLQKLQQHGCIQIDEELKFKVTPTFLGQLAAFYYIKHESISFFNEKLTEKISPLELIKVLSYSKEFDDVPLRHNEEVYNEALSKQCPVKSEKSNFSSSNEKTFLLFQMHLFRLTPPIRDYQIDAKLVIDNSIRIVSAMIDLAAEKQLLQTCKYLCLIMQMIMQGVWHDQSPLINIPFFTQNLLKKIEISTFSQLIDVFKKKTLRPLLEKADPKTFSEDWRFKYIEEAIKTLPDVSIKAKIFPVQHKKQGDQHHSHHQLHLQEGGEAIVQVQLHRENENVPLKVKVQHSGKNKDASWWILVGDEATGKLLALKKILFKNSLKKDIQISLPTKFEKSPQLSVHLISDSYLGLDQVTTIHFYRKDGTKYEKVVTEEKQDLEKKETKERQSDNNEQEQSKKKQEISSQNVQRSHHIEYERKVDAKPQNTENENKEERKENSKREKGQSNQDNNPKKEEAGEDKKKGKEKKKLQYERKIPKFDPEQDVNSLDKDSNTKKREEQQDANQMKGKEIQYERVQNKNQQDLSNEGNKPQKFENAQKKTSEERDKEDKKKGNETKWRNENNKKEGDNESKEPHKNNNNNNKKKKDEAQYVKKSQVEQQNSQPNQSPPANEQPSEQQSQPQKEQQSNLKFNALKKRQNSSSDDEGGKGQKQEN